MGKYHFSNDIRNFISHLNDISPLCSLLHTLLKDIACVCRTSKNCKPFVLQDKCNNEMFLSPASPIAVEHLDHLEVSLHPLVS